MRTTALTTLIVCAVCGLGSSQFLAEDGHDLTVIGLPKGKDEMQSQTTSQPVLSREERHRQIDEYLKAHRAELGEVVDLWFRSRASGARWVGFDK